MEAQPAFEFEETFAPDPGYTGSISPGVHTFQGTYPYYGNLHVGQSESLLEEKVTAYAGSGVLRLAAVQNNSYYQQNTPNFYPPSGTYNVWGTGYFVSDPTQPVYFNGAPESLTFPTFVYSYYSWTNNRDLLGSYAQQIGTSLSLGASYVYSFYNSPYSYQETLGSTVFTGENPDSNSESTREWRIFASSQLSNTLTLNASWYSVIGNYHIQNPNSGAAGTFLDAPSHYSAPRVGLVWQANSSVAVRAAAGGGYALAPVSYLVGSNGLPQCYNNGCVESLVNLNLRPETSFAFDVGADARIHRDTVVSLDLYRTNLFGQVFKSEGLTGGTYTGLPLYVEQYQNLGESRFEGVNLQIHRDVPHGIYWQAMLGFTRGYVVSVPPGLYESTPGQACNMTTGAGCTNTYVVPGINSSGYSLSAVPYANGMALIGYRWSPEKYVDISPTYYGKYNAYFQPAFVEVDAHIGYPITRNASLIAIFKNITGIHDQNWELFTPSYGTPTVVGGPYALYGVPYGPRSVTLTLNFKS